MKCEHCGSENVKMVTNIIVSFPPEWEGELTEERIKSSEFEIKDVNWDCHHKFLDKGYIDCRVHGNKEKNELNLRLWHLNIGEPEETYKFKIQDYDKIMTKLDDENVDITALRRFLQEEALSFTKKSK